MVISIVICTYNRCKQLQKVLQDLATLLVPSGLVWEVIIIDNNSTDQTRSTIEQFIQRTSISIRYVVEVEQGLSYARNRGIREARGDLIAFTDDDVKLDPQWLTAIVEAVAAYPHAMGFGGRVLPIFSGQLPSWFATAGPYRLSGFYPVYDRGEEVRSCTEVGMYTPSGANCFFRTSAFQRYGLFRTDLGYVGGRTLGHEDSEFSYRLLRHGEDVMYIPKVVVYHPVEENRLTRSFMLRWAYWAGRGAARRNDSPEQGVLIKGIPRYLIRRLVHHASGVLSARILQQWHRAVYCDFQAVYVFGMIAEFFISRNHFSAEDISCIPRLENLKNHL
jgi:glycosyltransferase involved in cell wall biosynthesis